jgi:hypothetical protein
VTRAAFQRIVQELGIDRRSFGAEQRAGDVTSGAVRGYARHGGPRKRFGTMIRGRKAVVFAFATFAIPFAAFALQSGSTAALPPTEGDLTKLERLLEKERECSTAYRFRSILLTELLERAEDDWAGSYASSNGFESHELELAPRGFFFQFQTCTDGDHVFGEVVKSDGSLVELRPRPAEDGKASSPFQFFEDRVYSIPWDGERFLVPASRMRAFCELVTNERGNAMKRAEFARKRRKGASSFGSLDRELRGLPEVPPEFRQYLPK